MRTSFHPPAHARLSRESSRHSSCIRLGAPLTKGHRKSRQEAKRRHAPGYPKAQVCPDTAHKKKKGVNKSSPAHTIRTEIAHRLVQRSKSRAFRTYLSKSRCCNTKLQESVPQATTPTNERGRGRGRGRGDGRGRGRGTGAPRPDLEMTASGPFAMGPALAGNSSRRSVPRSNFTPVPIIGSGLPPGSTIGHNSLAPVKSELDGKARGGAKKNAEDDEVYSEPDEGVEIIDMEDISQMDWMAPESLRKQHHLRKIKKEEPAEFPGRPSTVLLRCQKTNPLFSKQRAQSIRPMHSTLARVKKKRNWKISSSIFRPERTSSRSSVPDSLFGFE